MTTPKDAPHEAPCRAKKVGEYNMLFCCYWEGHAGEHCYVPIVDSGVAIRKATNAEKFQRLHLADEEGKE